MSIGRGRYKRKEFVSSGTFGTIHMAEDVVDKSRVALKRVKFENEDTLPVIREIQNLSKLGDHPNIIKIVDVVSSDNKQRKTKDVYMVFHVMKHDLRGLIEAKHVKMTCSHIKTCIREILKGLNYCHLNNIIHRDIKPANILINHRGEIKIADFGLSRGYKPNCLMSSNVVTQWYRSPELLLGSTRYTPSIDVWSVGCIMAELLLKKPLFRGSNVFDQIRRIWWLCGTPNNQTWPNVSKLPLFNQYGNWTIIKCDFVNKLTNKNNARFKKYEVKLLENLLKINPQHRITAKNALIHSYFFRGCPPKENLNDWGEYDSCFYSPKQQTIIERKNYN